MKILWYKFLFLFKNKDESCIPDGPYCYAPDIEKNEKYKKYIGNYIIITCPHYKKISKKWNGCKYLGVVTTDIIFGDQCKICGKNFK